MRKQDWIPVSMAHPPRNSEARFLVTDGHSVEVVSQAYPSLHTDNPEYEDSNEITFQNITHWSLILLPTGDKA